MKKIIDVGIILSILSVILNAESFSSSKKKLLKKVYFDNQVTFYCQNSYQIKEVNGKEKALIIEDKSKYTPRNILTKKGKINIRAKRVEWEHIVPAQNFGRHLSCWRDGHQRCVTTKGKKYKGRRCCKKVSPIFKTMESDMYNLVPSIGEINADRSNYRYMDTNIDLKGQYGNCKFKVDFKERRAYPADYAKGLIARTYLYFSKRYNMKLSSRDKKMFKIWDKQFTETNWEKTRKKRIERLK
ncbi:MAG: endonuclease [Sulfurovum sp.]